MRKGASEMLVNHCFLYELLLFFCMERLQDSMDDGIVGGICTYVLWQRWSPYFFHFFSIL